MKHDYSVYLVWSQEDESYLAKVPELTGCMADGGSPEEALANVREIAAEWIAIAKEEGREIPQPLSFEGVADTQRRQEQALQKRVNEIIRDALSQIVPQAMDQILSELSKSGNPLLVPARFEHLALEEADAKS